MSDLKRRLKQSLQDPEFKRLWDEDELEYQIIEMLIEARIEKNLSQKELSDLTGIRQPNISRIENGKCMPDIDTLKRIADATGKKLEIKFV